jgi:hypothetical protein
MTETEIVQKVCEILEIKFHHFDNHKMGKDYFQRVELTSIPKIVLYSTQYGMWEFAILEDMSIFCSEEEAFSVISSIGEKYLSSLDGEGKDFWDGLVKKHKRIEKAKQFLIENNCAEVINDPNKKVHF